MGMEETRRASSDDTLLESALRAAFGTMDAQLAQQAGPSAPGHLRQFGEFGAGAQLPLPQQDVMLGFQQLHQLHQHQQQPQSGLGDLALGLGDLGPLAAPPGASPLLPPLLPHEQQPLPPPTELEELEGQQSAAAQRRKGKQKGAGSSAAALDKEAKQALARQKNREAQQRFRERQRAKLQEASTEYDKLAEEVERLRLENSALAKQNKTMEKVLAVREAMMRAFEDFKCVTTEQQLRGVEGQSAQGLMAAIQNLPTAEDMDAFAAAGGGASGSSSPEASRGAALSAAGAFGAGEGQESKAPEGQAGRMWAGIRSGVEIDGSVLERAEAVPPPTNADIVRRVQQMAHPRDMIHYWHAWLVDLARVYESGEAAGWTPAHLAAAEEVMAEIVQVWWHAAQLRPSYIAFWIENGARRNPAGDDEIARATAARLGPQLGEEMRRTLRRAWQQYMRRLARAAVGVSRWVQRLHQMASPMQLASMRSAANASLELLEITRHMRSAVQEEYLASMEFLAIVTTRLTARQLVMVNHLSAPYLPDWVSMAYHILREDPALARSGGPQMGLQVAPAAPLLQPPPPPQQQQQQQQETETE